MRIGDALDLRYIVKAYLDKLGRTVRKFKNNLPGPEFVAGFLKRHKSQISQRYSQNIKKKRAEVSPETIRDYFKELEISLGDINPSNVINYDETNLTDDPGRKKIITKRGTKYPERVMNSSKSSVSLMMAATADGALLPPYVVYKAQHLYDTWTKHGPPGARFNRTASGWFDAVVFEDWIKTIIIPYLKDKEGKKCLIGDNLSSHLSIETIKLCHKENISFVFLPANSTHLTQPLDVAFFRPMKIAWRNVVLKWKKTDGKSQATIPKGCFPKLLNKLMEELRENSKSNIMAGFRKTGIYPIDMQQVLSRLPEVNDSENKSVLEKSVLDLLKEMRYGTMNITEPKRKKKLEVIPGRSVGTEGEDNTETEQEKCQENKKKRRLSKATQDNKENITDVKKKGKGVGKKSRTQDQKIAKKEENEPDNEKITVRKKSGTQDQKIAEKEENKQDNEKITVGTKSRTQDQKIAKKEENEQDNENISVGKKSRTQDQEIAEKEGNEQDNENITVGKKHRTQNQKIDEKEENETDTEKILLDTINDFDFMAHNSIETMPIIFEDMILSESEIVIDDTQTNEMQKMSKKQKQTTKEIERTVKVIANEKISDMIMINKIDLNKCRKINTNSLLQISHNVNMDRPGPSDLRTVQARRQTYYKNDDDILKDLMDDHDDDE